MTLKRKHAEGEIEFAGFDELKAHFEGLPTKGIAGFDKLKDQARGRIWALRGDIIEAHRAIDEAHAAPRGGRIGFYKEADRHAWHALKLFFGDKGIRSEDIKAVPPVELAGRAARLEQPYVGQALTILGISYINRRMQLDAVCFLERAVALDPENTVALRNLVGACNNASKATLERDTPEWAGEMDREITLGIDASARLLEAYEVRQDHITGAASVKPFREDSQTIARVIYALNTGASLLYKRGRHLVHDLRGWDAGKTTLDDSIQYSQTTLDVLTLPRTLKEGHAVVHKKKDEQLVADHSKGAAFAYTNIGSCHALLGNVDDAGLAYTLALEIKPDYKLARENLHKLPHIQPVKKETRERIKKQPAAKELPSLRITRPWEESRRGIVSPAELKVRLESLGLDQCNPDDVRAHAAALAEDVQGLDTHPSHCPDFLAHVEEQQNVFWSGVTAENLPEFIRIEQTLNHISKEADIFGGDNAGFAGRLTQDYGKIKETMLSRELEADATRIGEIYSKIILK